MDSHMDEWMNGWMDVSMDGWIYRCMDGCMDGWMDMWIMDVYVYMRACMHLRRYARIHMAFLVLFVPFSGWPRFGPVRSGPVPGGGRSGSTGSGSSRRFSQNFKLSPLRERDRDPCQKMRLAEMFLLTKSG